jgi:hypothetical protein
MPKKTDRDKRANEAFIAIAIGSYLQKRATADIYTKPNDDAEDACADASILVEALERLKVL